MCPIDGINPAPSGPPRNIIQFVIVRSPAPGYRGQGRNGGGKGMGMGGWGTRGEGGGETPERGKEAGTRNPPPTAGPPQPHTKLPETIHPWEGIQVY